MAAAPDTMRAQLKELSTQALTLLKWRVSWKAKARAKQLPPEDYSWNYFGLQAGRGFGKTYPASNWLGINACSDPGSYNFVVAPTHEDLMKYCFNGPTGLLNVIPQRLIIDWKISPYPILTVWSQGAVSWILGFSAEKPNRLRGPQSHRGWCDEVAAWKYPEEAWSNLEFGLRLGKHPQIFWTGTPKPKPFIRQLAKLPKSIVRYGSMYENAENLPQQTFDNIAKYEGTAVGRQEIHGELIDPEEAGFVKRTQWRLWPAKRPLPKFRFVVMSLDTAFTERQFDKKEQQTDPTACSVWGLFTLDGNDHVMLLDCWEEHLGFPELVRRVKLEKTLTYGDADEPVLKPALFSKQQRPRHQGRPVDLILIEDKGSGISLRQQLATEGILAYAYNPGDMDKLSRLHAVSPLFPHGRVWAVESNNAPGIPRTWADPLITQVCSYVGEGSLKHDDLLDSATQALLYLMHKFKFTFQRVDPVAAMREASDRLKREQRRNPYDG